MRWKWDWIHRRILAGELNPDVGEWERLFTKVFEDPRIEMPDRAASMMNAGRYYARQIVSGELTAGLGASAIWWELGHFEDAPDRLRQFAGLWSEYGEFEYRAKHDAEAARIRAEIDAQTLDAARSLLKEN